ncbi:MAG TPA: hypothetical protein VFF08_09010 [Trueperaceae bacterium]|nr:hypothetical protein [Trueperaceae bacterium]
METRPPHRRVVLYAVAGLAVVEVPLVHLLVAQLSTVAAWVVTGLSVVSFAWLLAAASRGLEGAPGEDGPRPEP